MRRAYRDRSEFSADPGFYAVPIDRLTSKVHAQELAGATEANRATASATGVYNLQKHFRESVPNVVTMGQAAWATSKKSRC